MPTILSLLKRGGVDKFRSVLNRNSGPFLLQYFYSVGLVCSKGPDYRRFTWTEIRLLRSYCSNRSRAAGPISQCPVMPLLPAVRNGTASHPCTVGTIRNDAEQIKTLPH